MKEDSIQNQYMMKPREAPSRGYFGRELQVAAGRVYYHVKFLTEVKPFQNLQFMTQDYMPHFFGFWRRKTRKHISFFLPFGSKKWRKFLPFGQCKPVCNMVPWRMHTYEQQHKLFGLLFWYTCFGSNIFLVTTETSCQVLLRRYMLLEKNLIQRENSVCVKNLCQHHELICATSSVTTLAATDSVPQHTLILLDDSKIVQEHSVDMELSLFIMGQLIRGHRLQKKRKLKKCFKSGRFKFTKRAKSRKFTFKHESERLQQHHNQFGPRLKKVQHILQKTAVELSLDIDREQSPFYMAQMEKQGLQPFNFLE
ncbi:unnamed protein product [Arabidopsis halleri]